MRKMRYRYKIKVQFLNSAYVFQGLEENIDQAVKYYNTTSAIARNPKEIVHYEYDKDFITLTLTLKSEEELIYPSKALRIFSKNLIDEHNFDKYISNSQLFKMNTLDGIESISKLVNLNGVELLKEVNIKAAKLITDNNLEKIIEFLKD